MPYLICYDIAANSLRAKMARKILEFGLDRINKSVYLGSVKESALNTLATLLSNWMQQKGAPQDSLIILPVYPQQIQHMQILGRNDLDKDELSGDKSTLIL